MKKYLIIALIAWADALIAQIPVRYFTLAPEGDALQMEYRTWNRVQLKRHRISVPNSIPMDRMVVNFHQGRPVRIEGFKPEESDVIPYLRIILEYNGEQLKEVREYSPQNKRKSTELILDRVCRPIWENNRIISEEVTDPSGKVIQKFLYDAPVIFHGLPLTVCDMFGAESGPNELPIGRTGVQYKGKMRHFQFITNEKKDTVFSLQHLRDTPDGYESLLRITDIAGATTTRIFHNQLKYDAHGNIEQHLSWDEKRPEQGILIQYRYRYKGDPEWNIPPSTHNLMPALLYSQGYWINSNQNVYLKFTPIDPNNGSWQCNWIDYQYNTSSNTWLDLLRKNSYGTWHWTAESRQLVISAQGKPLVMLSGRIGQDTAYFSTLSDSSEIAFFAAKILPKTSNRIEEFVIESPPVEAIKAAEEVEIVPPPVTQAPSDEAIYHFVEQKPSFPGGEPELLKYLAEHVKYPVLAKEHEISGRVIVSFIVEKDGSLSDIQIVRDIGAGCGKAVVEAVKQMPAWRPAQHNGRPVRVKYTLPVMVEHR